ncbi:MAG: sugar kinase [Haloarculaceae archaeon]
MTELVTFGETALRLSPADGERFETAQDVRLRVSGTESNVAVAASSVGADTTWLSKLPDTALGHRVARALHQHGIDTEIAWGEGGRQSLVFEEDGSDPRASRRYEDRTACAAVTVTPGELPMDRVQAADATFVAGSTLTLSGDIVETAEAVIRAAGEGLVAMDVDYQPGLATPEEARETLTEVFDAVDVLFVNESELETLFDRSGNPRQVAHAVASEYDFRTVVVTRSEFGALAWHDSVIHEHDGIETETVDPSGQHAALVGGFLGRALDGAGTDEALRYGVASATFCRTLPDPMTTATRAEIDDLVADLGNSR